MYCSFLCFIPIKRSKLLSPVFLLFSKDKNQNNSFDFYTLKTTKNSRHI